MVNCRLHHYYVLCNGMRALVNQHMGNETLFNGAGADERCALKWFSFTSLDHPDNVTHEELISTYHLAPASIQINTISSKFHIFDGEFWMSCKYGGNSSRFTGRFSSKG